MNDDGIWTWNDDGNRALRSGVRSAIAVKHGEDRYHVDLRVHGDSLLLTMPVEPWADAKARAERWVLRGER
jgi:hypothetical protein